VILIGKIFIIFISRSKHQNDELPEQGKKVVKSAKLFIIKKDEHDEHEFQEDRNCDEDESEVQYGQ
jgi:hypothetical protein